MIRRRGKSWIVQVYLGPDPLTGRKRFKSRSVPAGNETKPPKAVRDLEIKMKAQVMRGELQPSATTVGELMALELEFGKNSWSPWTYAGYESKARLYIVPALGSARLNKLTVARIDQLYRDLEAQGLSPQTIRHVHVVLRKALDRARRWGWIVANPAADATLPKVVAKPIRPPSLDEVAQLVEAAGDDLADAIVLAQHTGARRGELCGLRWSDIDLDSDPGRLVIRRSIVDRTADNIVVKGTKTNKSRAVLLGPTVVDRLRARRARMDDIATQFGTRLVDDAYVLSESVDGSEPLKPNLVTGRFTNLTKRLGIQTRFHDLRHANATALLQAGIPVNDVAQRLGHASVRMTLDVYGHASENVAAAWVFEKPR